MLDDCEVAWDELDVALPEGWVASRPEWDEPECLWVVRAVFNGSLSPSRPAREVFGQSEADALRTLAQQFRLGPLA
jgi:hypothetical protein